MRQFLFIAAACGVLASSAFAQSYGGYRDPYTRGGEYSRGYGANPVNRAMSDLQRAAASSYYARHQRGHFDHAMRELAKFENKFQRGRFDKHPLDEAIGELSHLSRSGDLDPRTCDILARDADELRAFRAGAYDRGYNR